MGHQSLVIGAIETPSAPRDQSISSTETNRKALDRLPIQDDWPFLVGSMFSISQSSAVNIEYGTTVIHFGASYKELEEEWSEWITKFEALLFQLQGVAAVVHLESERFGSHKLEWVAKPSSNQGSHPSNWEFVGGPRTSSELLGVA